MSQYQAALEPLRTLFAAMPPVAALGVEAVDFDGERLHLRAPLAANVNDKGSAFGGSLAALMTVAGWALLTLRLWQLGIEAEVYVADSSIRYLAPLHADLAASAWLDDARDWDGFVATLRERGRARLKVAAQVGLPEGGAASAMQARFVAFAKR